MKTKYGSNPTRQTVEELAEELNKSVKSVIGKLSREGVYQKSVYKTKTGEVKFVGFGKVEGENEVNGVEV